MELDNYLGDNWDIFIKLAESDQRSDKKQVFEKVGLILLAFEATFCEFGLDLRKFYLCKNGLFASEIMS